jgi:AcrR family transcriptional regulator
VKSTFARLPKEKRVFILDAAIGVFASKGYDGAGIEDICSAAGISNGALYKYFDNKDDLFLSLGERGAELVGSVFDDVSPLLPPESFFRKILVKIREFPPSHRSAVSLYMNCGIPAFNRFAVSFAATLEPVGIKYIQSYLLGAQRRGEISGELDIHSILFAIDSIIVLYAFSRVSQYHKSRLQYFITIERENDGIPTEDDEIEYLLRVIEILLKGGRT